MQDPYGALVALVLFDQKITSLKQEIIHLKNSLEKASFERALAAEQLYRARAMYADAIKRQDALDLDLKSCMQELARITGLLDVAASSKEAAALTRERDLAAKRCASLEEEIERVWEALSELEERRDSEKIADEKANILFDSVSRDLNVTIQQKKDVLNSLYTKRAEYTTVIPIGLLVPYERIHERIVNPYVPLCDDFCSGCGSSVSRVDCAAVAKHVLVPCQNCCRVLYDPSVVAGDVCS